MEEDFELGGENFNEPEEKVLQEEESFKLKSAIQRLNEREQKILTLKYWLDFSNGEIAKKFEGLSGSDISNAVLNAAFRAARKKLTSVPKDYFYQAVEEILESKRANALNSGDVEKRVVSKEYYDKQVEKISKSKRGKK